MTALNIATQIPNQIVTLEQLTVWALLATANLNNAHQFQLADNQPLQPIIQSSHFNDAANQRRAGFIAYLPLDPGYDYDKSKKLWMWANEISTANLSAGFTAN